MNEYIQIVNDNLMYHKSDGTVIKLLPTIEDIMSADSTNDSTDRVSRQYLLAEIDDLADEFSEVDENGLHSERWCGISDARCVIANAPFVEDRPQGEWIYNSALYASGNPHYDCSRCGESVEERTKFCPNCGRRMKGANDECN